MGNIELLENSIICIKKYCFGSVCKRILTSDIVSLILIFIVLLMLKMQNRPKILIKEFHYFNLHDYFERNFVNFNLQKTYDDHSQTFLFLRFFRD